jgi:hypothetical protein
VAFDLPALGIQKYFVPGACAQCHGHDRGGLAGPRPTDGVFRSARLNYLDTDQWTDMLGFDFGHVAASTHAVVFDGEKDLTTPKFKAAFDIVRRLNQSILKQVATVNGTDFKAKAIEKWLAVHAGNDQPQPAAARILSLGGAVWNPAVADEKDLLDKLNRYCFRCHSSIRYNVFDKAGVANANSDKNMEDRMRRQASDFRHMPNGRELPTAELEAFIALINKTFP